jgi:hypothetical protein
MARKPKAKRRGPKPLPPGARREVYSVRLLPALVARADAYGERTAVIERALTAWLDQWEGRAHEILAKQTE